MTEEQLNEGNKLFVTIKDIKEQIEALSHFSVEYDIHDTYLLFDEYIKLRLPEDCCLQVVTLLRDAFERLLLHYEEEFAAIGIE